MKKQTVQEVATALDLNPETIRRWARECDDFPTTSRSKSGALMLDFAAVQEWYENRLADRELTLDNPEYEKWRSRRMRAMALAAERENADAESLRKTGELQIGHLESCVQYVLAALVMPPLPQNPETAWLKEYSDWHISLRHWLQENWYLSRDNPEKLTPFADPKSPPETAALPTPLATGLAEVAEAIGNFDNAEYWKNKGLDIPEKLATETARLQTENKNLSETEP